MAIISLSGFQTPMLNFYRNKDGMRKRVEVGDSFEQRALLLLDVVWYVQWDEAVLPGEILEARFSLKFSDVGAFTHARSTKGSRVRINADYRHGQYMQHPVEAGSILESLSSVVTHKTALQPDKIVLAVIGWRPLTGSKSYFESAFGRDLRNADTQPKVLL